MDGGMLWMASSLSEIGFRVSGAEILQIVLQADDTVSDPERLHLTPRYAVMVDGDTVTDRRMQEKEETVIVFESSVPWGAEIRLRKLSECPQSLLAVREIRTDGEITPLDETGTRIEFIGDSITCGYGVEAKSELENFTTATENAGKSYAGLVTDWMGLDAMLTSFSGYGIISGYTGDAEKRNTSELLPQYYDRVGRNEYLLSSGKRLQEIPWDFSSWQPEKILIHLGTNDLSWCAEREPRKEMFRKQYKEFLATVRKYNPGAMILCVLGIMGTGLNEKMVQAVNEYRFENGDTRIHAMTLQEQDAARYGYGANFHPSEKTQERLAEKIQAFIQNT
jgi:lysophospholipase L1-like esterase